MKKLMTAVMIAGMTAGAWADVSFSYSGQLRNATGGAVAVKNPKITFSLYNVATGGAALWSRMIPVLLDDNGYFAVELSNDNGSVVGKETKLETVLSANPTLYIGLNVEDSSGEIAPRQRLLATPRAAFAQDVAKAKNDFTVAGTLSAKIIQQGGNELLPKGVIVMWNGRTPPDGWALCNGENGTPDLRGRFIVGYNPEDADYNDAGKTGGARKVTLTTDEMPSHNHAPSMRWYVGGVEGKYYSTSHDAWPTPNSDSRYFHGDWSDRVTTAYTGGGQSHENRPPYYVLAYIMKL